MKKHYLKRAFLMLLAMCFTFASSGISPVYASDAPTGLSSMEIGNDQFTIDIDYGIDGLIKPSCSAPIRFTVTNKGKDFQGAIHLVSMGNDYNQDETHYAREISIANGETRTVSMIMPDDAQSLRVELHDTKDKVLYKKKFLNDVFNYGVPSERGIVAILSDDYSGLNYLDGASINLYNSGGAYTLSTGELDETTFPDMSKALHSVVAVVIDNFDTTKLSDEQLLALKGFVNDGGLLIVSTGAEYNKVLSGLPNDLISGSVNGLSKKKVTFIYPEHQVGAVLNTETGEMETPYTVSRGDDEAAKATVELDIANVKVDGAKNVDAISSIGNAYCAKDYGLGTIIVTNFSLGKGGFAEDDVTRGIVFEEMINASISNAVINSFQNGCISSGSGKLTVNGTSIITMNDRGKRPKVAIFYIILIIYIIIIGPVGFIILKKKDKAKMLWVLAPAVSLAFVVIMYIASFGQTVRRASVNYLAIDEISEAGCSETVYASLTCPKKGKTNMNFLPEFIGVDRFNTYNGAYSMFGGVLGDSTGDNSVVLWEKPDHTMVSINSKQAFRSTEFSATRNINSEYDINCDIVGVYDGTDSENVTGTVTNNTDKTLKHVIVTAPGMNYYYEKIGAGETVDLADAKQEADLWNLSNNLYNYGMFGVVRNKQQRDYDLLNEYVTMIINSNSTTYTLYAIVDGEERNITDDKKIDEYGTVIVSMPYEFNYQGDGEIVEYDLNQSCLSSVDGEFETETGSVYSDAEVEYKFPSGTINMLVNMGASNDDGNVVDCFIYNYKTGQYDPLFKDNDGFTFYLDKNYIMTSGYEDAIKVKYAGDPTGKVCAAPVLGGGYSNANN